MPVGHPHGNVKEEGDYKPEASPLNTAQKTSSASITQELVENAES